MDGLFGANAILGAHVGLRRPWCLWWNQSPAQHRLAALHTAVSSSIGCTPGKCQRQAGRQVTHWSPPTPRPSGALGGSLSTPALTQGPVFQGPFVSGTWQVKVKTVSSEVPLNQGFKKEGMGRGVPKAGASRRAQDLESHTCCVAPDKSQALSESLSLFVKWGSKYSPHCVAPGAALRANRTNGHRPPLPEWPAGQG